VRGVVRSPRVRIGTDAKGEPIFGVDPRKCVAQAETIELIAENTTRYGQKVVRGPVARDGSFDLGLDEGLWRVAVRQDQAESDVFEYWYAIVQAVADEAIELGENAFSNVVSRGRVVDHLGAAASGLSGVFGDRDGYADGRGPLLLGGDAYFKTDKSGSFGVAFSKYDGPRSAAPKGPSLVCALLIFGDGPPKRILDVLVGSFTEVVLDGPPSKPTLHEVTFDVAADADTTVYLWSESSANSCRMTPDPSGSIKFTDKVEEGEYVVEVVCENLWFARKLDVRESKVVRIDPSYRVGRTVTGSATGRVSRVVDGPLFPIALQSIDASGRFVLEGLPPEGELIVLAEGKRFTVPANSGSVYELK
jgi:hypothetical protein